MIYYFINYEKEITAIGETNPPYMKDRGYALVSKEEYEKWQEEHPVELLTEDDNENETSLHRKTPLTSWKR